MITIDKRAIRTFHMLGINSCIWNAACADIMRGNAEVIAMTADVGRVSGMGRLAGEFPDRFFNMGISEQSMMSAAAGMAMSGFRVFASTYAPFITYRCADQMRHLMGNLRLDIKAIGSAAGLSSGFSGNALLSISDMAFACAIPNLTVLSPADSLEAVKMTLAVSKVNTPVYMRCCGTGMVQQVYREDYDFEIGRAVTLREGSTVAIMATGTDVVAESVKAADALEKRGVSVRVDNHHTIKPLDVEAVLSAARTARIIVTVEEHNIVGGLGSAVASVLAENGCGVRLVRVGVNDCLCPLGSRKYMLTECGLDGDSIARRITEILEC